MNKLRMASFRVDVTPPIGHSLCGGLVPSARAVRDPLFARGLILDDGKTRVVLCAVDFCEIVGAAHRRVCRALAQGADTSARHIALHTVHQHDAPYIFREAEPLLKSHGIGQLDEVWWEDVVGRLGVAATKASRRLRVVTTVGVGEARVADCASNRRMIGSNGKVSAMRFSLCSDPKLKALPVGLIDPLLRSVTFWSGPKLLASMNYYATHPQSAHGRGIISADTIGEALRRTEERFPSAEHLYFTGCSGNITLGKYSSTRPEKNISLFGSRLGKGIVNAIAHSEIERVAPGPLGWSAKTIDLPFRVRLSEVRAMGLLGAVENSLPQRVVAAWALAAMRTPHWNRVTLQSLRVGPARIVYLPSEMFLEYQLFAQELLPGEFVAVAAYGDGKMFYVPTANAFQQGGYELEATRSYTTRDVEPLLKNTITQLLK
jgi:hypothetical protein